MQQIVIKCNINLPKAELDALEEKLRHDYETGFILIPYYCDLVMPCEQENKTE